MRTVEVCACVLTLSVSAISAMASPQNSAPPPGVKLTRAAGVSVPNPKAPSDLPSESAATKLPVRRVVLYKSGVGYFEHVGEVRGDQAVRIDFTSSQLNDVLQSLTVLDLNGGRIAGVNYNSEAPLNQRLGMLSLPLAEQTDLLKFYGALRGARLEVRSGTTAVTGRLLSVERETRVSGGTTLEVDLITLVSDAGEVRSVEVTPAVSVRLAERDVNDEVGRYLGLLSSAGHEDLRRMTIATSGTGDRQLYVSYISEVPVWKTTYRIVLPSKPGEEPLLQGWAIVDNTVGEDWNNVELSLVAGAPQSFIERLSEPYYARRPIVGLPEMAGLAPQTHESAMLGGLGALTGTVTDASGAAMARARVKVFDSAGNLVASKITDSGGHYKVGDLPAANYKLEISHEGFQTADVNGLAVGGGREVTQDLALSPGSMAHSLAAETEAQSVQTENAAVGSPRAPIGSGRELGSGRAIGAIGGGMGAGTGSGVGGGTFSAGAATAATAARGQELGDLFEYKVKDRITIHKNESSLVPIVQTHVGVEKVSVWNPSSPTPRPLRALWLTNSSPLTLDGGSFSILEEEAFAGEGLTDPIKPGEKRLLSYAADLGVRVESRADADPERVTLVRIARGTMVRTSESRQETSYTVRNDDTERRTILIEHPQRRGWVIGSDGPKPVETTSTVYRFRITVEPKSTATLAIHESRPVENRFELTNLTDDQIKLFLQQGSINAAVEAEFRKIIEQKNRLAALDAEISKRNDEKQKIYDDQQRLRENLKALKGSPEERALTERYTGQLAAQETRLETLERESADFGAKRDRAQEDLDQMIQNLSLDTTI
jgi:hypothetical protein